MFQAKYEGKIADSILVSYAGSDGFFNDEGVGVVNLQPSADTGSITYQTTANTSVVTAQFGDKLVNNNKLVINGQELTITGSDAPVVTEVVMSQH